MANLGYVEGRGSQESHTAPVVLSTIVNWFKHYWPTMLIVLIGITAWEVFAALQWIKALFFPPPSQIISGLADLITSGDLVKHLGATLLRLIQGFLLGALPGLLLGLLMGWSARLRLIIDPFVAAIHSIPKIALLPLVMVIFGIGEAPKIVLIGVSAFFPMLISVMVGVRQISPVYYEVAENYGARGFSVITNVLLPASLPEILAGLRLALNTALLITIALEMVASNDGLGELVWLSWQTMRVDRLYASLLITAVLGLTFNSANQLIAAQLAPWKDDSD